MGPVTRITGSFADYCALVMQSPKKNFLVERRYYATKVCLMLYQCLVKETVPKRGCLVDFFTTTLPSMRAYTHAHRSPLFKT